MALLPDMNDNDLMKYVKYQKVDREKGVEFSTARVAWDSDTQDAVIHADIDAVKNHPNYEGAKSGNIKDAVLLAKTFIDTDKLKKHDSPMVILPITAEEKQGKNAIPLGMAQVISEHTGFPVFKGIVQNNKAGHTGANGWHRIVSPATFEGDVLVDASFLVLDDFIGMGGTLANVRSFLLNAGAKVAGYEILTGKQESDILFLRKETLKQLRAKHGQFEKEFKTLVGFDYTGLTESEANYLLRAKTVERIRNQITKAILRRNL